MLYKYHINKESEIDLDLPELQQTPGSARTKSSKSAASNSQQPSGCSLTNTSPYVIEDSGFNPFAAADSRSYKSAIDPDWANKLMETYKPNILEQGAKFSISFSLIEESILAGDKILLFSQSLLTLDLIEEYLQKVNVISTNERWKKYKNYFSKFFV